MGRNKARRKKRIRKKSIKIRGEREKEMEKHKAGLQKGRVKGQID